MVYKRLLLVACCLCLTSGAWAMKEEEVVIEEKSTQKTETYFLEFEGKPVKISRAGLELFEVLMQMIEQGKDVRREGDDVYIKLDNVLKMVRESVPSLAAFMDALHFFAGYADGAIDIGKLDYPLLEAILAIANRLHAGQSDAFKPVQNLLDKIHKETLKRFDPLNEHKKILELRRQKEELQQKQKEQKTINAKKVGTEKKLESQPEEKAEEKFQGYDLEFFDETGKSEIIPITPQGFKLTSFFVDFEEGFGDEEKFVKEDSTRGRVLLVTPLHLPKNVTLADARRFVHLSDLGSLGAHLPFAEFAYIIKIADKFGAERKIGFNPKIDVLDYLLEALKVSIQSENRNELLQKFLDGKGELIEIVDMLPKKVLNQLMPVMPQKPIVLGEIENDEVFAVSKGMRLAFGLFKVVILDLEGEIKTLLLVSEDLRALGMITAIAWLSETMLAVGTHKGYVQIIDLNNLGEVPTLLRGRDRGPVNSLIRLSDGRLASASGQVITIWDLNDLKKEPMRLIDAENDANIELIIQLSDGRLAVKGGIKLKIWDLKKQSKELLGGPMVATALVELPGERLACRNFDAIDVFDLKNPSALPKQLVVSDRRFREAIKDKYLAVLSNGRLVSGSIDGIIRLWALDYSHSEVFARDLGKIYRLSALPDGRLISFSEQDIRIWNTVQMPFDQSVVFSALSVYGPQLVELQPQQQQGFMSRLKSRFGTTQVGKTQEQKKEAPISKEEQWYRNVFGREHIMNIFVTLPDVSLRHLMQLKGTRLIRIAVKMLLDGLKEDMDDEDYIQNKQQEIANRLEGILRLLKVLNLDEKEWTLDPLVQNYRDAKDHAVRMKALLGEEKAQEKKVEGKEKLESEEKKK